MRAAQTSQGFIGVMAALFLGSAAMTIAWCNSMSALHDMPMCSGRTLSDPMAPESMSAYLAMWLTMMVAMMLPSLTPMLMRYRRSVFVATMMRLDALTAMIGLGYFFVWTVCGALAFASNAMLADIVLRWPPATGVLVLIAGMLQFSPWKARHLACCRNAPTCCDVLASDIASAWRHGLRLGIHCVHCCFGLTVVLLAIGMMDLRAMALVTAVISIERLVPGGLRAARLIGGIFIVVGLFMIARAMI